MYLFLQTQTTVRPDDWDYSTEELFTWPRLVQLAWLHMDSRANLLEEGCDVIQPEGFDIPHDAVELHGITTMQAVTNGSRLVDVLIDLAEVIDESKIVVAHDVDFHSTVLFAEYKRENIPTAFDRKPKVCTLRESSELRETKINDSQADNPSEDDSQADNSGEDGSQADESQGDPDTNNEASKVRPGSIAELHNVLFEEQIEDNQDAANNVRACAKCFFELRRRGVVNAMF